MYMNLPQFKSVFLKDLKALLYNVNFRKDGASVSQSLWKGKVLTDNCQLIDTTGLINLYTDHTLYFSHS